MHIAHQISREDTRRPNAPQHHDRPRGVRGSPLAGDSNVDRSAGEPSVVNADTMADFYARIGIKTGDSGGLRTFETEAAAAAGLLARRQLLTRNGNGT